MTCAWFPPFPPNFAYKAPWMGFCLVTQKLTSLKTCGLVSSPKPRSIPYPSLWISPVLKALQAYLLVQHCHFCGNSIFLPFWNALALSHTVCLQGEHPPSFPNFPSWSNPRENILMVSCLWGISKTGSQSYHQVPNPITLVFFQHLNSPSLDNSNSTFPEHRFRCIFKPLTCPQMSISFLSNPFWAKTFLTPHLPRLLFLFSELPPEVGVWKLF